MHSYYEEVVEAMPCEFLLLNGSVLDCINGMSIYI